MDTGKYVLDTLFSSANIEEFFYSFLNVEIKLRKDINKMLICPTIYAQSLSVDIKKINKYINTTKLLNFNKIS